MSLRAVLIGLAALALLAAAVSLAIGHAFGWPVALYATLALVSFAFERARYRPRVDRSGRWEATGERFADPTTGQKLEVYYNPDTGQRDYRPLP